MQDSPPKEKRPKRRPTAASIFPLLSLLRFHLPASHQRHIHAKILCLVHALVWPIGRVTEFICIIGAKLAATRTRLHAMHAWPATLSRICKSMCRAFLSLSLREYPRHTMTCFASSPAFYREYAGHGCVMLRRFNPCLCGC